MLLSRLLRVGLSAVLFLYGPPIAGELSRAWDRTLSTGSEGAIQIQAVAWDETAGELVVLIRTGSRADVEAESGRSPARQTIWRFDPTGKRLEERPISEQLERAAVRGLAAGTDGLTLVSASDDRLELVVLGRGGELKSRRALTEEIIDFQPIETLVRADGTVIMGGAIEMAVVAVARPDRASSTVTTIPTEGHGAVLDVAPARGGNVLVLVHGREQIGPMYVFSRGEIHVVLLSRDAEILRRVRLEGRLGSLLDTGRGYAVLLDLGAHRRQEWWLFRFDDELREIARLRVVDTEPAVVPRLGQLLAWPGAGFVAVLAGSRGEPWIGRFSTQGLLQAVYDEPASPEEPRLSQALSTFGGDALYVVAPTSVENGDKIRDAVRILKFVED